MLGAAILAVVPYGPWLLLPFGVLAALLPYGKSRNFGLSATFLTPLVVLLIDLLSPAGWRLAGERLVDTLLACVIVLLIGYAPWPTAWQAHLPGQFASTLRAVAAYLDEALVTAGAPSGAGRLPARHAGERRPGGRGCGGGPSGPCRTCAPSTSGRCPSRRRSAAARRPGGPPSWAWRRCWTRRRPRSWPSAAAPPRPPRRRSAQLTGMLRAVADAIEARVPPPPPGELPSDPALAPVTAAVRSVLAVLTRDEPRSRGEAREPAPA